MMAETKSFSDQFRNRDGPTNILANQIRKRHMFTHEHELINNHETTRNPKEDNTIAKGQYSVIQISKDTQKKAKF